MSVILSSEHQKLLAAFLMEESARGRREQGVIALKCRVPWFLRFMEERGKQAAKLTLDDAREYQGYLIGLGTRKGEALKMRTVVGYMGAASAFCFWLARSDMILDNPFASVRHVRLESTLPEGILTEREMALLLDGLRQWKDETHLKNMGRRYLVHVVAELQYASGLRISEVAALKLEDVDIERALVYVRDGKHGSARIGFLTDYAAGVLECYLSRLRAYMVGNHTIEKSLFSRKRQRLQECVNVELSRLCPRLSISACTSHGFRHALGYHLLRSLCPLRYIQSILGHKNIKDTEVYTRVDVADIKAVLDACHPRVHG